MSLLGGLVRWLGHVPDRPPTDREVRFGEILHWWRTVKGLALMLAFSGMLLSVITRHFGLGFWPFLLVLVIPVAWLLLFMKVRRSAPDEVGDFYNWLCFAPLSVREMAAETARIRRLEEPSGAKGKERDGGDAEEGRG